MLLIIDNYDSFTFNLVHYFQELGAQTRVIRNDAMSAADALALGAEAIVLSPGPCDPDRAGMCLDVLREAPADLPILGVCLGHQAMGQVYGGKVVQAREIMHGKTSPITHDATGVFAGLPSPFAATRYHSLAVELPQTSDMIVNARTADGEIMGLRHRSRPVHGVQFHPESIASEHGHTLLKNFLGEIPRRTGKAA
ncbi:aminodeoxychorismate/anthranilate synthase component II [Glycocaulis abyssi]|uniref:Aminodeoxychorismate/anthranilate synthase component II n=1 Tax=Glycocaulis abyssi TaxID=1433403 RepID=A0ABV9N5U9_9PROT